MEQPFPVHQRDKRILVLKAADRRCRSGHTLELSKCHGDPQGGPGLAVGCAIVLRPSEFTPLSALALAELAERAGLPRGVFNVVTCLDAEAFGKALCTHPDVAKIYFTGSTKVGRILMQQPLAKSKSSHSNWEGMPLSSSSTTLISTQPSKAPMLLSSAMVVKRVSVPIGYMFKTEFMTDLQISWLDGSAN